MTTSRRPHDDAQRARGPLTACIATLAGTPDDASTIDAQLLAITRLAADTIPSVSYASITAVRDGANTTVATSSDLATAVDEAQYADDRGPCLDTLRRGGGPLAVDIAATMTWPGFREAADRMGLKASLSIPFFAGSGITIAVLNLYSHDLPAMLALNAWVLTVYDTDVGTHPQPALSAVDAGGQDLINGLIEAFEVCAVIQRAIGTVMLAEDCYAEQAYLILRVRAAEAGVSLTDIAATLQPPLPHPGGASHQ